MLIVNNRKKGLRKAGHTTAPFKLNISTFFFSLKE